MPADRDPRVDPVRNDIVRTTDAMGPIDFLVVSNDGALVTYVQATTRPFVEECGLHYWREWAATDEIVRRGDAR